jgi:hypothetical protein
LTQLLRDLKLAFNRYRLHLNTIKTHPLTFYARNRGDPENGRRLKPLACFFLHDLKRHGFQNYQVFFDDLLHS